MGTEAISMHVQDEEALEQRLAISAKMGDENALELLMEKYKGFIHNRAKAYFLIGADKEDIIQEGMIGLYKAIKNYDEDKDVSFKTFADICITRQIITAVKAATRQKHIPLNSCLSLNKSLCEEDTEKEFIDIIATEYQSDPEELIISEETAKYLREKVEQTLSELELRVLKSYLQGKSYGEIASCLNRGVKSIDNAIQRIKRKLGKCLDSSSV